MSRRRRQKSPLLMRCILISIGANLVILPVLAYFGAFKNIAAAFHKPVEIIVTPPPPEKDKVVEKKEAKKEHKVASRGSAKKSGAPRGKPLAQRVVAANVAPGSGGGNGPSVLNPDKGVAPGTLPSAPGPATAKTGNGNGGGNAAPAAKPAPQPKPTPKPAAPPAPAPKPHIPVMTDVATTYSPQPTIPDDLRDADFDSNVTAQIMVSTEGDPEDVKIVHSSGNDELDSIALDTAKRWRFKPATRDGVAIESRVLLHIEFQVQ